LLSILFDVSITCTFSPLASFNPLCFY
jgi:hypothetical protein